MRVAWASRLAWPIAGIVLGATYQAVAAARDRQRYRPAGSLIAVGGHRLHLSSAGTGGPAVILEAPGPGLPAWWGLVQPPLASITRVCCYDRAGIGWSDPSRGPRSGLQIAADLHGLLHAADIAPPYVLVGASFGGHFVRLYASQYPDEVAGLVLVDALHEDMLARFPSSMRRLVTLTPPVLDAFATLARLGIVRLLGRRLPGYTTLFTHLPSASRAEVLMHLARPEQWWGMYAEAVAFAAIEDEVRRARAARPRFGDLPLVVLTAGATWEQPTARVPGVRPGALTPIWLALQQDLASLSTNSRHVVIAGQTHQGLLVEPDGARTVVAEIGALVQRLRDPQRD